LRKKQDLFIQKGESALPEIRRIHDRLKEILKESETDFPLSDVDAAELRAGLRDQLLQISATEKKGMDLLQSAIV
jgi:hypothetical protein